MRRLHRWLGALFLVAGLPAVLQAQTGSVQGTVVDATTGQAIVGAQVSVVGTPLGGLSNEEGRFTINGIPAGTSTVRVLRIGYGTEDVDVTITPGGTATVAFELVESAIGMEEIVVTALGVERARREVTTSVQTLSGDDLIRTPETNIVSALSGQVSGVHIISSNTPGGSARMVIRGVNSLTGNNQPLFVIDGIPVSNASSTTTDQAATTGTRGYNAIDYGNLIQDLNPDDIESISVLKGANAAALYGSRAANGVVLITTKSGAAARGIGMTARTDVTFESPLRLPDYQNQYGQGFSGNFVATEDQSWGPRLDGQLIEQPLYDGQAAPFVANPNNVRNFFETGRTVNTSVAIGTGGENANLRLSIANMDHQGMLPGFAQRRTSVGVHANSSLTERLSAEGSLQYVNSDTDNRPAQGYGEDNVMWQFIWFGRQVDTEILRQRRFNPDGTQFNWNSRWNNNPYWTQLEDRNWDSRDRVIGGGSLTYGFTPWLDLMLRAGTDYSSESRKNVFAAGTRSVASATGAFEEDAIDRQETNIDFLLTAEVPGLGDDFGVTANFGGNRRDNSFRSQGVWASELVVPRLYDLGNAAVTPEFTDYRSRSRVNSLYGSVNFALRDFWYVDVTGRNDWSSTLPANNNSYFYPSVSTSLVFSDLVELPAVTYGKLRLGWAQVANDAEVYQLVDPYLADVPFGSAPRFTASNTLRNFDLKPEVTDSWEIGGELRFLDDRLGMDLTYYNTETRNQIVGVQVSPLTGFSERMLNAGTIANRGVELMVDVNPVLTNDFRWDIVGTFGRNENEVVELADGLQAITLDTYYGVSVEARVGEPYGIMVGRQYVRDPQGNIVVSESTGRPLNASDNPNGILGNYQPEFTWGLRNQLQFGPFSAQVLVDGQSGGSIYSLTSVYGRRAGVLAETLRGREQSADQQTMIIDGVYIADITDMGGGVMDTTYLPNQTPVRAQDYWRLLSGLHEEFVYDATYVKLREARIGFQLPPAWTSRLRVSGAEVAVTGRNLFLWTDVPHIDPETAFNAGNVQGFEYGQLPTPRSFGFSLVVTP